MKYEHTPRPSAEKSRSTVAVLLEPGGYFDSQTTDSQYYGFSESQTTGYIPEQPFDMDCSDGSEYSPECYGFSQPVDLINEQEVHTESKPDDASNTFIVPPGYKFMTPADRLLHEDESYANFRPSAMDLPILKRWGTDAECAYAKESLVEKHLGDPLTYAERSHSEDFIAACGETAVSGERDPNRLCNAVEVEAFAMLTRLTQTVPLLARLMMEGRWNDVQVLTDDARLSLSSIDTLHCVGRLVDDQTNPEFSPKEVDRRDFE